ncbi:carboxypeptidase-like regulatory domain-containing protein, partial [Salinivirga cyanobacteriivorans]
MFTITIKRMKYFLLFFFIQSITFAQSYNNIQILDATSGSPLAYARIYNTETGRGLITNEDGVFRNAFHDTTTTKTTIRVTHIGYKTVFFSPAKLNSMSIIKLKTNTYSLAEVVVMPKSWAIDFLHQVIKNHVNQSEQFQTYKTYLIANSTIDDTPVELIQAYYNGKFSPFTVDSLRFKSGRIAHAPYNNTYFLNLNPADLFSQFHPF